MKHLLLIAAMMTGCATYKQPVSEHDLAATPAEAPFGLIALTVSQERAPNSIVKSDLEIDLLDGDRNVTSLRVKHDQLKYSAKDKGIPVIFKLKPGTYALSNLKFVIPDQRIDGNPYNAVILDNKPKEAFVIQIEANKVLHIGHVDAKLSERKAPHRFDMKGKIDVFFDKPTTSLWSLKSERYPQMQFSYLIKQKAGITEKPWGGEQEI